MKERQRFTKGIKKKFLTAAEEGDIKTIASLLERGIDPNLTDEDELETALTLAIHGLTRLFHPYDKDELKTARTLAAGNGHWKVIELLIEKGADVNFGKDEVGVGTALHKASDGLYASMEAIKLLTKKGADVNAMDVQWRTALHHLSKEAHFAGVKFLIENGANVNAKDLNDYTALHLASNYAYIPGSDLDTLKVIKILIESGADIEARAQGKMGWTALHYAACAQEGEDGEGSVQRDQLDIVKLLIELGADINAQNGNGWTALHFAVDGDQLKIAKFLIEQGADAKIKNNNGKTPSDIAKKNFGDAKWKKIWKKIFIPFSLVSDS